MNQKVIVDAGMFYPFVRGQQVDADESYNQLRFSALTCDSFMLTSASADELQKIISYALKFNEKHSSAFEELKILLKSGVIQHIEENVIYNEGDLSARISFLQALENKFRHIEFAKGVRANKISLYTDATMLVYSDALSIPILTQDTVLRSVHCSPLVQWYVPLPIDEEKLREIPMEDLVDASNPFRSLFRETFEKLKRNVSVAKDAMRELKGTASRNEELKSILQQKNSEVAELQDNVRDLINSERFWQELAKPDSKKAIVWSVAEVALGFLPVPVPTSAISYFIESKRYEGALNSREK